VASDFASFKRAASKTLPPFVLRDESTLPGSTLSESTLSEESVSPAPASSSVSSPWAETESSPESRFALGLGDPLDDEHATWENSNPNVDNWVTTRRYDISIALLQSGTERAEQSLRKGRALLAARQIEPFAIGFSLSTN
jgi:hypothetical protein